MSTSIVKYSFIETTCGERSISVVYGRFFYVLSVKLQWFAICFFRLFSTRETFLRLMSENLLNKTLVVTALPFGGELNGR